MKRRRSSRTTSLPIGIICVVIVSLLSTLGVGFASWAEGLEIQGVITTGSLNVIFTECKVTGNSHKDVRALVTGGGSGIEIEGEDQSHPLNLVLHYSVKNVGSIPIVFDGITPLDPYFDVRQPGDHLEPGQPRNIIDPGQTFSDTVIINFREGVLPTPGDPYTLGFGLNFRQ